MSSAAFVEVIAREHERIELKTGLGRKPIQATLVAFSNTEGGMIICGVTDSRNLIERRRDQGFDDEIHGAAFDASNVGRLTIQELDVDGITVTVVVVQPRTDDVAQTSDGRVLVRQGGHNRALTPREVTELYLRRSRLRFELTDSGIQVKDADDALAIELAKAYAWSGPNDLDRWRERDLVTGDNLTMAGALVLTDPKISLQAAKFRIDVRQYGSDAGTSYRNRRIIEGPVQHQVLDATEVVITLIGTEMIFTGVRRHDVPRLPRRVVREVIANAVAHRAYD